MSNHHDEAEPQTEAEETREFRRDRRDQRARFAGLAWFGALAGIVLAVPVALGWVGDIYRLAQTPARVEALEAAQKENVRSVSEMKESLARIEGALHITNGNKQKEEKP
jgi:hypothetical protein